MNAESHIPYQQAALQTRHVFVSLVTAACRELGVTCDWSPDNWIARLTQHGRTRYIYGYQFPVNNATAAAIMKDKAATSAALTKAGVANVPHYLLRPDDKAAARSTADYAITLAPLPIVIKPNEGTGGTGIIKCDTYEQAVDAIGKLTQYYNALAVSPFVPIAHEYRVVVLNNTPYISYAKLRQNDNWRHNLALGSKPYVITDKTLCTKLEQLALQTMQALDANVASVDIIDTHGELHILEVNSGIMLNNFSQHSPQNAAAAHAIYTDIIKASMQ